MQTKILSTPLEAVGEEIGSELGAKMVKDFQDSFPSEIPSYHIGRNILDRILAQPGCVGIRFYMGINELGQKTLVYVGVDNTDSLITEYQAISNDGLLVHEKGIVADRSKVQSGSTDSSTSLNWW